MRQLTSAPQRRSASLVNLASINDLRFHCEEQVKIAEALDRANIIFFPNSKARLTTTEGRENQEPIRADSIVFLQTNDQILHLEFETRPYSEPPIAFRMLDYYVRLKRQYSCPIHQFVIFLQQTTSEKVFVSEYTDTQIRLQYRVIRLWEQDPALLLSLPGLLPLAALSKTNSPRTLLEQIANRIATIEEPNQQADLLACTQVIAGLRFEKDLIRQLFRKETMRESVIYQEIREDGLIEGRQQGLQQGLQQEALSFVTRQLTRRIGAIAPQISEQIQTLSIEELENLGEALLDFSQASDLVTWLNERQP